MRNHRKHIPFSTASCFDFLVFVALGSIAPASWNSDAWARQRGGRYVAPDNLSVATRNAWAQSEAPKTTPLVLPITNPNSPPLAGVVAACGKEADRSEPFSLPGAKGDIKLDRCYRGRAQHICANNALLKEGRSLVEEYGKIIDARYPELNSVSAVCAINPDKLAADVQNAAEFSNRFRTLNSEYESRSSCAGKISQSLREVVLPDLAQAPDMIKSMVESFEGDSKDLAVVQAQVVDIAGKIDASKKAMITIGKIHQAMCVKDQPPEKVSDSKSSR